MIDARGELIYVGKAKCLRARLLCYFRPRSRDPKAGRIMEYTRAIVWEVAPSEFAALLRELELIQRWQPRFNFQGQPYRRRRTYVCLGRPPAPYLFLNKKPPADTVACYGPVPSGPRAREAVRRLNDQFRLRDCAQAVPLVFADQSELFPVERTAACLRYEIGTCLGPCAAACSRAAYAEQVRAARAFLAGKDVSLLNALQRAMMAASDTLAFERAQILQEKIEVLRWLHEQLQRLRLAQERHSFIYPIAGPKGRAWWYLIHRGRVAAVIREPHGPAEAQAAAERIEAAFRSQPVPGPLETSEVDGVFLVAAWFRRHADERGRTLKPAEALRRCRNLTAMSPVMS
jgi:excinuclease ABC subunit C